MALTGDKETGQPSAVPTRKVASGGVAGLVTAILLWVYGTYMAPGQPVPPEIASTITAVVSFVISYLVPPASTEMVLPTRAAGAMGQAG